MSEVPVRTLFFVTVHAERSEFDRRWGYRFVVGDFNFYGQAEWDTAIEAIEAGTRAMANWSIQRMLGDDRPVP